MSGSFRLGTDGIYRCDEFQEFPWQEHGFGTRAGIPKVEVTLRQVHSDCVINVNGVRGDRVREGDALITNDVCSAVGIRTADCVPLLLLDTKTRAVGAVHAGWRGASMEIVSRTLEQLNATFGTNAEDVYAAIGPCVRDCCYEVGAAVAEKFARLFPEWDEEQKATRQLNLPEANCRQLMAAGVPQSQIFDSGLCTACDTAQFFSYRREPKNAGRLISAISRLA